MGVKSERLVVLLSKEEKARIAKLAKHEQVSMVELARGALLSLSSSRPASGGPDRYRREGASRHVSLHAEPAGYDRGAGMTEDGTATPSGQLALSAEQGEALERLAGVALRTMERANAALDHAFEEIAATKGYFERKRSSADHGADPGADSAGEETAAKTEAGG